MRAATEWPPWTERVGRFRTMSWQEASLFAPLGILSVLLANAERIHSADDALAWAVVGIVGVGVAGPFAAVVSRTPMFLPHDGQPVPVWVPVLGAAMTGAIFGVVVVTMTAALGLSSPTPAGVRILGSTLFVAWFGVATILMFDGRDRIRRERQRLLEEMVALEAARQEVTLLADASRRAVLAHVETTLGHARDVVAALDEQQVEWQQVEWSQVAAELRETAEASVRPLSRELHAEAASLTSRPRPWSFIWFVLSRQPMRPLAVSALYAIGALGPNVQAVGWTLGVTSTTLSVVVICFVMLVTNAAMTRWPRWHAAIYLTGLAILQAGTVLLRPLSDAIGLPRPSPFETVAAILAGIIIVFTASAFGALRKMNVEQMAAVAADIDDGLVESLARSQALAQVLREAAGIVHGEVQARLVSCALAIEQAGRGADAEQLEAALARARSLLVEPLPALTRPVSATLADEIARKRALWDGLCAVEVDIDPELAHALDVDVAACGRIVEEGIANAVRHGNAMQVTVRVRECGGAVEIVVDDDGSGPQPRSVSGLGQAMIAAHSRSWSLARDGARTRLVVEVEPSGTARQV